MDHVTVEPQLLGYKAGLKTQPNSGSRLTHSIHLRIKGPLNTKPPSSPSHPIYTSTTTRMVFSTSTPNTDSPIATPGSGAVRCRRQPPPARWNPYSAGLCSGTPAARNGDSSSVLRPTSSNTVPSAPRLTPRSIPSIDLKSVIDGVAEVDESRTEDNHGNKPAIAHECTDDFIDSMLGVLSLIYCSPLILSGGKAVVVPRNFSRQPTSTTASRPEYHQLRWFVKSLLERTHPPRAVCQLALSYLVDLTEAVKQELKKVAEARICHSARDNPPPPYSTYPPTTEPEKLSPLVDPRRVLLAVLILAHKFLLDKTWMNKSWAKISGLTPTEVSRCERTAIIALGHRLWTKHS